MKNIIDELYEMKESLAREIGEANKRIQQAGNKISTADLDIIDKLTHSMKSVATTCAMLEAEEEVLESTRAEAEQNRSDLNDLIGEKQAQIAAYQKDIEDEEAAMAALAVFMLFLISTISTFTLLSTAATGCSPSAPRSPAASRAR